MATPRHKALIGAVILVGAAGIAQGAERYGIGRRATAAEIAAWNIDIDREGKKLPPGSGSVVRGREVFEAQCASCHGIRGEGGTGNRLEPVMNGSSVFLPV
jgi:S-disulfanyl-L-cysteine oxidoreductase SoxD